MSTPLSGLLSSLSAPTAVVFITPPLPPCRASTIECDVGEALVRVVLLVIALLTEPPQGLPQLMRRMTSLRQCEYTEDEAAIVTLLVLLGISLPLQLTLPLVQSLLSLMSLQVSPFDKLPSVPTFALNAS